MREALDFHHHLVQQGRSTMNLIFLSPPDNTLEQERGIKENEEVHDGSNSVTQLQMGASTSSDTSMTNEIKVHFSTENERSTK
jgi:hypothetical protein